MSERAPRSELKNISYEILIGALSILSILNLALMYVFSDQEIQDVLWVMNGLLSAIFLVDFTYRLATAPSRSAYFFRTQAGPTCWPACRSRSSSSCGSSG